MNCGQIIQIKKGVVLMAQPAKSAKLQLLEGNPAKRNTDDLKRRAENEDKMKMSNDNVVPPSWLNKTAKQEFERLAKLLVGVELVNDADVGHLAMYCDAYANYISFKNQVKQKGMWIEGKPNPFLLRMKDASAQMRSFASDLGLSPSARAKLAISLEDDADDEDDF